MTTVHELVRVRPEVEEGDLHGIISLYGLLSDEEDAFEKDAERVLNATFATVGIRRLLQRLKTAFAGEAADRKGNFVLSGGYGSGKSHLLLALYHVLTSPNVGRKWLESNDIEFEVPSDLSVILMPMNQMLLANGESVAYLWQPIFEALEYDGFEHTGNNFPTAKHLQEAIAGRRAMLIIDEVERWHGAISDEPQADASIGFLQNLTELCENPDNGMICLVSLLRIEPEVYNTIDRTDRFVEDLTSAPDREDFVLHRLVAEVDEDGAGPVIQAYLDEYNELHAHVRIGDYNEYRQRMLKCYPFHPETIDVVFERYSSVARKEETSYQNSRGAMYLLAHALRQALPLEGPDEGQLADTDLIRPGDIALTIDQLYDDLLNLNPQLVDIARRNLNSSQEVEHAVPVLSAISLHSLGEEESERRLGAEFGEVLLGALRPGDSDQAVNANQVRSCLTQLEDTALNLHIEENPTRWLFKAQVNIQAQINRRARGVPIEEAQAHIVQTLREIIGDDDRTAIYPTEEVPDRRDITFVVSTNRLKPDEILEDIYHGRSYPNGLVIVGPREHGALDEDSDLTWMAQRVIAAEGIYGELPGEADLRKRLREFVNANSAALRQRIEDRYGSWQVPIMDDETNQLTFRRVQVGLDRTSILAAVEDRYTETHFTNAVMDAVRSRESVPPKVEDVRADFYRQRSYPKPVSGRRPSDKRADDAIRKLVIQGELQIVKGGDAHDVVYQDPGILDANWTVAVGPGEPPQPREEWITGFVGNDVRTAGEIRAECQRRSEQVVGKAPTEVQVDEVVVRMVNEGMLEALEAPEQLEPRLPVELKIRKKPTQAWSYTDFGTCAMGALLTRVVRDLNKTDLLRSVHLWVAKTAKGGNVDESLRDAVGLSAIPPGEETEVKVTWEVLQAPATNRDQLVEIIKALPDDPEIQVRLTLDRQGRTAGP